MAERRMFAKTIVTSDAFLDMPATARCLYFTLGMFADDDGFVNNPKSIMRQVSATADDMGILLAKKFILAFESGVIVIKHWRIHNYIQADRRHATKYQDEMAMLDLDENKAYTMLDAPKSACIQDVYRADTGCIQDVSISDTEDRIGKDRIGKNRIGEISPTENAAASRDRVSTKACQDVADMYNEICISLPKCKKLTDKRKRHIKARLRDCGRDQLIEAFKKAEASDFLTGKTGKSFRATLDWITQSEDNIVKILEGRYDNSDYSRSGGDTMSFRERAEMLAAQGVGS